MTKNAQQDDFSPKDGSQKGLGTRTFIRGNSDLLKESQKKGVLSEIPINATQASSEDI